MYVIIESGVMGFGESYVKTISTVMTSKEEGLEMFKQLMERHFGFVKEVNESYEDADVDFNEGIFKRHEDETLHIELIRLA